MKFGRQNTDVLLGIDRDADLYDATDRNRLNTAVNVSSSLGRVLVQTKDIVTEDLPRDNSFFFGAGTYGNLSLSKPQTRVQGGSGAYVTGAVKLAGQATVCGMDFQPASGAALALGKDSKTVFVGCTFGVLAGNLSSLVAAEAGAYAKFIGCTFYGSGLGQVVDNAGVIGDIVLVGCVNLTGAPVGTVTVVG